MLPQNLVDYTFLETAFKLLLLVAGPKIQSRPNSGRLFKKLLWRFFYIQFQILSLTEGSRPRVEIQDLKINCFNNAFQRYTSKYLCCGLFLKIH